MQCSLRRSRLWCRCFLSRERFRCFSEETCRDYSKVVRFAMRCHGILNFSYKCFFGWRGYIWETVTRHRKWVRKRLEIRQWTWSEGSRWFWISLWINCHCFLFKNWRARRSCGVSLGVARTKMKSVGLNFAWQKRQRSSNFWALRKSSQRFLPSQACQRGRQSQQSWQ